MSIPDDPYFAGPIASKSEAPVALDRPFVRDWAYVFLANLIVPLPLGLMLTGDFAGLLGMLLALVILFRSGWRVTCASRRFERGLRVGGWLVAVFQILPVFQVFAGMSGVVAASAVGFGTKEDGVLLRVSGLVGGFVATMVTGVCLISAALILGLPVVWADTRANRGGTGLRKS